MAFRSAGTYQGGPRLLPCSAQHRVQGNPGPNSQHNRTVPHHMLLSKTYELSENWVC